MGKVLYRQSSLFDVLYIDSFAGGGGASTGIELATGHPVDIAINHDESAIMMHKRNHPFTTHYREDVWQVDPVKATGGKPVQLAWFSPDCKHFSRAKGSSLVNRKIRGLAWVALRWAGTVHPDVIMLENVPEFVTWGPVRKGKPVKNKAGQTYKKWHAQLEALGYKIETKELCAADYGAPTSRTRFYLIARRDNKPIVWPKRTHAPIDSLEVRRKKLKPWRQAAEVIDFTLPAYSIFDTKGEIKERYNASVVRPLSKKTLNRVAGGLDKFVLKSENPFLVESGRTVKCAYLTEFYGNARMGIDITRPMQTITAKDRECLTLAYISEFKGIDKGQPVTNPLRTITACDGQFGVVKVNLSEYGKGELHHWPEVRAMLNEYCGYDLKEDEIALLKINGKDYFISDIAIRMLTPRELYNAMGFPEDYIIDKDTTGKKISRAAQVARCGNAVCPAVAEALARVNIVGTKKKIKTMDALAKIMCS